LSGFIAAIRRCVSDALALIIFAVAMAIAPVCALAAPYADFVIDARTGEVLHQTNADARLHPASLTKMMTLYIAFQAIERGEISLDTVVTVSPYAAGQAPSRLGLRAGQKIALRYLIRAAAIKSANDAAAAIGDAIEGDRASFAKRMNRTAKALGMTRTTFQNANGLTAEGHLSTARDMTTLGRHLFYDFPQYYSIFSRRTADAGIAQVASTNRGSLTAMKARTESRPDTPARPASTLWRRRSAATSGSSRRCLAASPRRSAMRGWPSFWTWALARRRTA
jgi:D-alanyl-D-alanine carboxypeptidase